MRSVTHRIDEMLSWFSDESRVCIKSVVDLLEDSRNEITALETSLRACLLHMKTAGSPEAQEPVAYMLETDDGEVFYGPYPLPEAGFGYEPKTLTPLYRHPPTSAVPDAHEIWAAAQLAPGEGIEDGVLRISALLVGSDRAVPEGWKLVPVEPTDEMLDAAYSAVGTAGPVGIFKAMLAAAPKQGGGEDE